MVGGTNGAVLAIAPAISMESGVVLAGTCAIIVKGLEKARSAATLSPPGDCTSQEHLDLQADVDSACHANSCKGLTELDCSEILKNESSLSDCITARSKINAKCFRGGDDGHKRALQSAIDALILCQTKSKDFSCE